MDEHAAMGRALALAWHGWGRVQPNPLVGAVVLAGGVVVGEGWHAEYGQAHAEPGALAQAGDRATGGTLVVTLEPCNHTGKQPPCVDAILAAGIARVVVALADPNPVAAGGAERLRAAGVTVEFGLRAGEAAAQNARFLAAERRPDRPWVALKLARSLDGKMADHAGASRWISGPEAREWVQWLRAGFDAIGVGGATARADDPLLTVRGPLIPRVPPARVVFARTAEVPTDGALIRTATDTPVYIVAGTEAPEDRVGALQRAGARVLRGEGLGEQLRALRGAGVQSLLVEGGGRLAGALLAAGLVDRGYLVQAPIWLGDHGVAGVVGVPDVGIGEACRWRQVECRSLGGDALVVLDAR
jgi:diaminohydroxyphosphoribosylaminopyrimidine deaminase/5-amino-6-(5-phosphoribosylamino)uracil reductase